MNFSTRPATIVAALAMAATGALILNQSNADAATIATVHSGVTARLYTANGSLVNNRALGANTPWLIGKTANINGETMYQVSTNEYLKASDSDLTGQSQAQSSNKVVGRIIMGNASLVRDDGIKSNRSLAGGSSWQIGKHVVNKNGTDFYQVSTHEYVEGGHISLMSAEPTAIYIADFGIDNSSSTTDTSSNNDHSTDTDTNTNVNTNTNTGSTTDTNTNTNTNISTPSTSTDTSTTKPSTPATSDSSQSAYQQAILADINSARASKGLSPLTMTSELNAGAAIRAQDGASLIGHVRPDGSDRASVFTTSTYTHANTGENMDGIRSTETRDAANLANEHKNGFLGEAGQGHYKNWIYAPYTQVGIGVYHAPDGNYYVAEEFAIV